MPFIKRTEVETIVRNAIKQVSDIDNDADIYKLDLTGGFVNLDKIIFLANIKKSIVHLSVEDELGKKYPTLNYDLNLSESVFNTWVTVGNCIEYIIANIAVG